MQITLQDKINGILLGIAALSVSTSNPHQEYPFASLLLTFVAFGFIWLFLAVMPLFQWFVVLMFIGIVLTNASEGNILGDIGMIFSAVGLGGLMLYLRVSKDSLSARYWRIMWSNLSPVEEKTNMAMAPYFEPHPVNTYESRSHPPKQGFSRAFINGNAIEMEPEKPAKKPLAKAIDEKRLIRNLNSVGKKVFVEYFDTFQRYANGTLTLADLVEILVSDNISNDNGAKIRASNAKSIFESNYQVHALQIIMDSKRLDSGTVAKARALLR